MRLLPCGTSGLLVELDALDDVLALYAALVDDPPVGVVDLVPAARTLLLHVDPEGGDVAAVGDAVRAARPERGERARGGLVEVPVVYDGEDLDEVGRLTGWGADGVVERHTAQEWTVAFCGFAPGFGYLVAGGDPPAGEAWQVPRRSSPRTRVPAGSVALAGEFSGVYPRESPGGWQLVGRTGLDVFDLRRDPPALLVPGARVRFTAVDEVAG
ncbi:allophanate hydrolase subunit 1 [Pseudokineococcus basanitobsidens]|uniref:Allophanate hydrolase subunit 1 n=1 Tax=Pseudokineococcus basanitobsidens TaxID=1926649 RepID=A0ABU8RFL0_9ACTN